MDTVSAFVSTATVLASIPAGVAGVRAYRAFGGLRQVSCPETQEDVLVRIHVARAIASRMRGGNELCLRSCSRWPGRQGCNQACLSQVTASPNGCRVGTWPTSSRLLALPGVGAPRGVGV